MNVAMIASHLPSVFHSFVAMKTGWSTVNGMAVVWLFSEFIYSQINETKSYNSWFDFLRKTCRNCFIEILFFKAFTEIVLTFAKHTTNPTLAIASLFEQINFWFLDVISTGKVKINILALCVVFFSIIVS